MEVYVALNVNEFPTGSLQKRVKHGLGPFSRLCGKTYRSELWLDFTVLSLIHLLMVLNLLDSPGRLAEASHFI